MVDLANVLCLKFEELVQALGGTQANISRKKRGGMLKRGVQLKNVVGDSEDIALAAHAPVVSDWLITDREANQEGLDLLKAMTVWLLRLVATAGPTWTKSETQ